MNLLPINFPLNETPAQRFIRVYRQEVEREKAERLKLWDELREKVEKLPTLMDAAKSQAEASGSLADGYINGSEVGELFDEIEYIRKKISIDFLI